MNPEEEKTYRQGVLERLDRIETQTTQTNGRVRWSEKMIYLAVGGLGVLTTIVLPTVIELVRILADTGKF